MGSISLEELAGKRREKEEQGNGELVVTGQGQVKKQEEMSAALTPEERKKVDAIKESLDLTDSQACIQYGTGAQRNISDFSESILSTVRSKDSGYVGELLSQILSNVKDLEVDNPGSGQGFLDKIPFFKSVKNNVDRLVTRYEKVQVQIDRIEAELEKARMSMLKDIGMFDTMYEKNLEYFHELNLYIAAGDEKIKELRETDIPRLQAEAAASTDPMAVQLVRDFEENVNRFEKKVHDLKLSRTIAIQTAPQIKLIQNNDKLLVDKIQTATLNTIPIWKSQIVIALGLGKQQKVLQLNQEISETTNELLKRNSQLLRTNTVETARESERSVVDLETLKKTNEDLIATIQETLQIQQEGRKKRQEAEGELVKFEDQLKQILSGKTPDQETAALS